MPVSYAWSSVGAALRKLRLRAGRSLRQAAELTGISRTQLSALERDERPPPPTSSPVWRAFAELYGCNADTLVRRARRARSYLVEKGPGWRQRHRNPT